MGNSLLKRKQLRGTDDLSTPKEAVDILCQFVKPQSFWEIAYGKGLLAKHLTNRGFQIIGKSTDFFKDNPTCLMITNPPFSLKDKFLERCYELKKPFALLLPITALEGIKRQSLYKKYGLQIIFLPKRIDFTGKKAPWFAVAWFTHKLNLPKDIMFGVPKLSYK